MIKYCVSVCVCACTLQWNTARPRCNPTNAIVVQFWGNSDEFVWVMCVCPCVYGVLQLCKVLIKIYNNDKQPNNFVMLSWEFNFMVTHWMMWEYIYVCVWMWVWLCEFERNNCSLQSGCMQIKMIAAVAFELTTVPSGISTFGNGLCRRCGWSMEMRGIFQHTIQVFGIVSWRLNVGVGYE